jgi:hypothetical protein
MDIHLRARRNRVKIGENGYPIMATKVGVMCTSSSLKAAFLDNFRLAEPHTRNRRIHSSALRELRELRASTGALPGRRLLMARGLGLD